MGIMAMPTQKIFMLFAKGETKMKKSKKLLGVLLSVALLVTMVAGCSSDKDASTDGKVVISVGNFSDPDTNPETYKIQMEQVKDFERLHPNIKIEPVIWDFDPRTYIAKAEGGTLPNVYYVPFTEAKNVIDSGYAADITDEFKKRGFYDSVNEFILQNISRDGKIYLLPTDSYDVGFIVNLKLFAQAGLVEEDGTPYQPKDWDDVIRISKIIKEKTGKAGLVIPTTDYTGGWRFTPVAWSFGTVFETKVDGKWKATFDSDEGAAALQFIKDLKWKHDILPANTLVNSAEVEKLIGTSEAAMTFGEQSNINKMVKYGIELNELGMVQMPAGPVKKVSLMGGSYRVIDKNSTPEQIAAGFEWLAYQGTTTKLTDEIKESFKKALEEKVVNNQIVGVLPLSPWSEASEVEKFKRETRIECANVDLNHIKLYNDKTGMQFQAEEPIDAQALYAVMDTCLQRVLTDENADCKEVLKKAAADFQKNNLDYVN